MNIRKLARPAAALLAAAALMAGIPELQMEAQAAFPEYLKSVTYFGDAWPINYWGTEDDNMGANFARIKADGFNSIILVIPWREFQPGDMGNMYNEAAFAKLDQVMKCADDHGLMVTLRIGYCWDYSGDASLPERYAGVVQDGSNDRKMWIDYCKTIYDRVSDYGNFQGGFITWEDFWDYTSNMDRDLTRALSIRLASRCGYQDYLKAHYSLAEVGAVYGKTFQDYSEIWIPERKRPEAKLFFEFYDSFLNKLLSESQEVFPGLSMEVRSDGDPIYQLDGSYTYYSHSATYPCADAEYSALMYSVSLGQQNVGDHISAETALASMQNSMNGLVEKSGKKYFMEQFLYADSTEAFSYNTQIEESQVADFVKRSAPILKDTTCGYGLWVYRNYVNDCVYNGQFALGLTGWDTTGKVEKTEHDGSKAVTLSKDSVLSQNVYGRLGKRDKIHVKFWAAPKNGAAMVTFQIGDAKKSVQVTEAGNYECSIPWQENYNLSITTDRSVTLDNIKMYSHEQYGRIYDTDGNEQDLAAAFRELNAALDQTQTLEPVPAADSSK